MATPYSSLFPLLLGLVETCDVPEEQRLKMYDTIGAIRRAIAERKAELLRQTRATLEAALEEAALEASDSVDLFEDTGSDSTTESDSGIESDAETVCVGDDFVFYYDDTDAESLDLCYED